MDSFSSFKTDDSSSLNSMKLMSPIEACYRSPLRDTTNCVIPLEVGGNKKSDPVGPHQLPGEKREYSEENDISQCQQSTPVKHLDCDTESDTTAEYESAGEASPWEKPSNISALADYLAGVHLSTPDKIYTELTSFPFSPISAEDECDDEVTAIISNASQSSSHTLSFHERDEIYISKQDKTVSHVANTSFSDVDPEEFKNSIPCKRHSEANVSFQNVSSEEVQISNEAIDKEEINTETEISCSRDEKKLKVPNNSLSESVEITSSVIATVEELCDSVNNKITHSETVSPATNFEHTLNNSIIQSNITDPVMDDTRSVERSPSFSRSTSYVSSESPVSVIEKDIPSLNDSLDGNNITVISEMESSTNVLQTSHINDYVTTTKHKIDTIFSSKKEIVSNVISETKQQIDNMFKRKSPIKELASNTVSHVIDSIKNLNVTESDISPQKNVVMEKISSPISSAKQKIDSLFSPKKKLLDKEIFEQRSVSEVSTVNELSGNEPLTKENIATSPNASLNTITVEHLNLDTSASASGLSVIPLSEKQEVIETAKQQIDQIFKSLSPQKFTAPNEFLELSNSTMSTDLEMDDEICLTSSSTYGSGFELHNSKQCFGVEFSVDESLSILKEVSVGAKQNIYETTTSSKEEPISSEADKSIKLECFNETSTISEVLPLPVNMKLDVTDNISDGTLDKTTTADEVSDITDQENNTEVQGDEKTFNGVDRLVIQDSVSDNNVEVDVQHSTDYQSTFEVFNKSMSGLSRAFHVISPKKESFNISLSTILDQKEDIISENITEPLTKIPGNDFNMTNMSENQLDTSTTSNSQQETSSVLVKPVANSEPMPPQKPSEEIDLQVSSENLCCSDIVLHKEVKNIVTMHKTVTEEVIDNQIVYEDIAVNNSCDSLSNPQGEALDTTAVVHQITLKKEEVEDFVVVDVAELDNQVSEHQPLADPVSLRLSLSGIQEKEVLEMPHAMDSVCIKEKDNAVIQDTIASTSEVNREKISENQIQIVPGSPSKELMKDNDEVKETEVKIVDVEKPFDVEHSKKDDVELAINISKNALITGAVDSQENVTSSSPVVSSVEVKKDVLNIVFDMNQSNVQLLEVSPMNVEFVNEVESTINITENNLITDSVIKKVIPDAGVPAEDNLTGVVNDTEIKESIFVCNENNDIDKKTNGDSTFIKKEEQLLTNPVSSSLNIEFVDKVKSVTNSSQNDLTTELVVKKVMDIYVPAEEKLTGDKVEETEGYNNISVLNEKNDYVNIALEEKIVDSNVNTLQNDEHNHLNISMISKSSLNEECIRKTNDFVTKEIQSETKQGQTYVDESNCHLNAKLKEEKNTVSEIVCEELKLVSSVKTSFESEPVVAKPAQSDCIDNPEESIAKTNIELNESVFNNNGSQAMVQLAQSDRKDNSVKSIAKTNVQSNESVVFHNHEAQNATVIKRGKSPLPGAVKNDLFGEIFQQEKDQMFGVTAKNLEGEQNCDTFISKSIGIPSQNDFFKNSGFSDEDIHDKVKSPPFACPVSSDSIAFGSPSGHSLSLSPIDTFTAGTKCGHPSSCVTNASTGDSTSTVSSNNVYSSSAEIGMGLKNKSLSESVGIVQSAVSKQNNELSTSLQATFQVQGEMSTRNEKYSYTFNKKDFRGSHATKNNEEVKYSSGLIDKFKTFKLDDLSKSTIERKSYEDLLDRCLEQERLLGFDETIKEEADKLIKELANASSDDICTQPDEFPPANANNSEAGPVTADEDLNKADLFQDATLFDFDYLAKCGGKGKQNRRLIRDSLFLNFDPLAATLTPEPAEEMAQADSSSDVATTPLRPPLLNGDEKLVDITPSDEAACSPASSTVATPPRSKARPTSCSATPTLRHEILSKEISKLQDLMMRQESSYQEQIAACTEEVEQLREKLAELEARDHQEGLQGKLAATEAEAVKLRKELTEATESKKQLMLIMEEYEKTISQVVTMREDDKKKFEIEKEQISMEREGAMQHLRNMEIAFNDVHQKYEKCKEVIEAFKHNEEQYKISLNENRKTIIQQEENYQKLKEHAAQKLEQANIEISEMKKAHQAELAKMIAVQRKMEIRVKSLEESLEQKKREAAELTKICDDLITKVEQ